MSRRRLFDDRPRRGRIPDWVEGDPIVGPPLDDDPMNRLLTQEEEMSITRNEREREMLERAVGMPEERDVLDMDNDDANEYWIARIRMDNRFDRLLESKQQDHHWEKYSNDPEYRYQTNRRFVDWMWGCQEMVNALHRINAEYWPDIRNAYEGMFLEAGETGWWRRPVWRGVFSQTEAAWRLRVPGFQPPPRPFVHQLIDEYRNQGGNLI